MAIEHLNENNFEAALAEGKCLVDFWATWCGPCRMQAPILEKLDAELGGSVKIFKVDVDENPALAQKLGIASIPTLLATENGKVKDAKKFMDSQKDVWGDFVATTKTTGAKVDTPPTNTGSKMTKDQIFAIKDAGERQAAIAANADLFTGGGKE